MLKNGAKSLAKILGWSPKKYPIHFLKISPQSLGFYPKVLAEISGPSLKLCPGGDLQIVGTSTNSRIFTESTLYIYISLYAHHFLGICAKGWNQG